MVEVPSAALMPERFDAAFYSIGSNDLTQYVLAAVAIFRLWPILPAQMILRCSI